MDNNERLIERLILESREHKAVLEERERLIRHLKDLIAVRDRHISAARREALEEAAQAAETCFVVWPLEGARMRDVCARAIRALKEKE